MGGSHAAVLYLEWIMRRLALLTWFLSCSSATLAAESAAPRAWLATRGEAMAVIVGETHAYTIREFDAFFEHVVSPSFEAADLALLEGHFGNYTSAETAANLVVPCDMSDRRSELVVPRFKALMAATRGAGMTVPDWMSHWEVTPEIALHSLHLPQFVARDVGPAILATRPLAFMGLGVGGQLKARALAAGRVRPVLGSLETLPELRGRYCSATAEQRQDLLVADLEAASGQLLLLQDLRAGRTPNLEGSALVMLNTLLSCAERREACPYPTPSTLGALARYGMGVHDSPGFFKLTTLARTEAWRPRILQALDTHRRLFVSVGAIHLPDLVYRGQVYPGLLTLLRRDGFKLLPIHAAGDLPPQFIRRSWWERLRGR
jgi:hypothetical protein